MIDGFAKEYLHDDLRWVRETMLWKLDALPIDAPGYVPWWPRPHVKLFNVMVHLLTETNRHAGRADILRERLDGAVGTDAQSTALREHDAAYWESHSARIEQAAQAADPTKSRP